MIILFPFRTIYVAIIVCIIATISSNSWAAPKHGLAMFEDIKYPPNFSHLDYVNPNAPKRGSIKLATIGTFDSLNPYILKGIPASGLSYVFETLMESSLDETFTQYGLIAESVEVADDHSWIRFHLRPEAKWHNNTPITAEDVVFSFNTLMEKGHPLYQTYYKEVTNVKALDHNSVQFYFSEHASKELTMLVGQLPIISKTYYSTHDFALSTLTPPLGSGPYIIDQVNPGHSIRYKRNPNYWGKNIPINKGRYNFDSIEYDYYRDATVAIQAFKSGEYDFRQENISKVWATAYDSLPALKNGRLIKTEIPHSIPTGMQAFIFNTRNPSFSDSKVREALSYCFDFEWTNNNLFYGAYTRTNSYFSNSLFAATGLPNKKELALLTPLKDSLPPRVFTDIFHAPKTDGTGNIRPHLRIADTLLNEAGWIIKDRKRVSPVTGKPMEFQFLLNSNAFERVIAPIIKNLERLGITATMRVVDTAQYQKRLDTFDYDIIVHVYGQSNSPGNEQIHYWHSSQATIEGSQNYAGIQNPAIDTLVKHVANATSKEKLTTATKALDRALLWNFYMIPNWHIRSFRLLYWNKFEQPAIRPQYGLGLDSWWSKEGEL